MLYEEIDKVVGDRMPTLQDMPAMPVVWAFVCETMRWRPNNPDGIPHTLYQDEDYAGYRIPAGAWVHPLQWTIGRDAVKYPYPDSFLPNRWLHPAFPTHREPLDVYAAVVGSSSFGYGDGRCPAERHVELMLFLGVASIAWLFNASLDSNATRDSVGGDADPTMEYTSIVISKPLRFPTKLSVRSKARLAEVERKWEELRGEGVFDEEALF